jgi:hypothetical protein
MQNNPLSLRKATTPKKKKANQNNKRGKKIKSK